MGMYQQLVGRLVYISHTHPDITYAVGIISRFMQDPKEIHLQIAYRVFQYLKGTPGNGVLFKRREKLLLEAYTDADYAGSIINRRSISGYCTFLGENPVTWRSKKQSVVARSSAEAEFRAMADGVCELPWIKNILDDPKIKWDGPMRLYCDDKSAISIAHNPVQHGRIKHIKIDTLHRSSCVNNGTKYFNSILQNFLNEKGLIHQSSCVNNPQQNGNSKRKIIIFWMLHEHFCLHLMYPSVFGYVF